MHVKKGDKVKVIAGKDKGKTASVIKAIPKMDMVLVEGINMKKKHQKPRKQGQKGQVIDVARPVHVSNVAKVK
jgi:large subunit ribosomal protein L24